METKLSQTAPFATDRVPHTLGAPSIGQPEGHGQMPSTCPQDARGLFRQIPIVCPLQGSGEGVELVQCCTARMEPTLRFLDLNDQIVLFSTPS